MRRYEIANKNCLYIKHECDERYDKESISTHDNKNKKATSCSKLEDLNKFDIDKYDVLGIDEGQFFPDITEFSEEQAKSGK